MGRGRRRLGSPGGRAGAKGLSRRFGDGYMITVRTKGSQNVKDVVRFFSRNFPEAVLKVGGAPGRGAGRGGTAERPLTAVPRQERHHTKVQLILQASEAAPASSSRERAPQVCTPAEKVEPWRSHLSPTGNVENTLSFHLRMTSRETSKAVVRLCPQEKQRPPWTLRPGFKASCSTMTSPHRVFQRARSAILTTVTKMRHYLLTANRENWSGFDSPTTAEMGESTGEPRPSHRQPA